MVGFVKRCAVFLLTATTSIVIASACYANDPRCAKPPYGGTVQEFQAIVKYFGGLVPPAKFLSGICNIRYGGNDRAVLYNLGFTDQEIDNKPLADLWVDTITAIHHLAEQPK
jgi:hypothetical protein